MNPPSQPSPQAPGADLSGRRLGEYLLLRRLGRGAMAEVYLAEQPSLRRQVAVKVLKPHLAGDETYIARFRNEAQAAASLVHGNIVQVHEVGCIDGVHFIVQEYVHGQNLRQWLDRKKAFDAATAAHVLRQCASALHRAGEQGIVHRDLKPENILITRAGEVKVADFGLARIAGGDAVQLTQVGMTLGTPLYMSPEQVEGRRLDPRSDMYSLGVTGYHMLAGRPPFEGETPLAVAVQHLRSQPEALENLRPDVPPALCRIIHRMMAKDPAERFTPRELLAELRTLGLGDGADDPATLAGDGEPPAWLQTLASQCAVTQRLSAVMQAQPAPRSGRRGWMLTALGIAAALAAAVAAGGALRLSLREPFVLEELRRNPPAVPKQASAQRQWLYASRVNTEAAWKSVGQYFPEQEYQVRRAQQGLARLYLRQDRYAEALEVFEELAALDPASDREFRAFGLAGKFVVLTLVGRHEEASALMAGELMPLLDQLRGDEMLDPDMQQMVRYALRKNTQELNRQNADQQRRWLDERFGETE